MQKLVELVNQFIDLLTIIAKKIMKISIPTLGVLIVSDIIIGTKFMVFDKLVSLLSKIGITGNLLTILLIVALVLWWEKKK